MWAYEFCDDSLAATCPPLSTFCQQMLDFTAWRLWLEVEEFINSDAASN